MIDRRSSGVSGVQPALGLARAHPAALAADAGGRAVRAADRSVAPGMELVDGKLALADVRPDVVIRPVGQRARLPELVPLVPAELRRPRPARGLVATDAGDPAVEPREGRAERA